MQNRPTPIFGVSPAYLLSAIGTRLEPRSISRALPTIRAIDPAAVLPLGAWEPEIYDPADLPLWTDAAVRELAAHARDEGLAASQFVAHFLGPEITRDTADEARSAADRSAADRLARVCEIATALGTSIVVVPLLPPAAGAGAGADSRAGAGAGAIADAAAVPGGAVRDGAVAGGAAGSAPIAALAARLGRLSAIAARGGCCLAVELVPAGPVPTTEALVALRARMDEPIGCNLDTGNAVAAGERAEAAAARLAGSIVGTHLCDAVGDESSRAPGEGQIDWPRTLAELRAGGYTGTYDVEIRCNAGELAERYRRGLSVVAEALAVADRAAAHTIHEEHA